MLEIRTFERIAGSQIAAMISASDQQVEVAVMENAEEDFADETQKQPWQAFSAKEVSATAPAYGPDATFDAVESRLNETT